MIKIFIGFEPKEEIAYHVLSSSILRRSSEPVQITPIILSSLHGIFNRERNPLQSTEFSFSRFLTPYLSGYEGWSIFMDCDMLMLDDVANLWKLRDEQYALMCVHHDHKPATDMKFLNQTQTKYERKNWSSMMLMNNARCKALTPFYVETATGLDLHRFKWLRDEEIGAIPGRWNHLVDYDPTLPESEVSNLHYTEGGPYFEDYKNCSYADIWRAEHREDVLPSYAVRRLELRSGVIGPNSVMYLYQPNCVPSDLMRRLVWSTFFAKNNLRKILTVKMQ